MLALLGLALGRGVGEPGTELARLKGTVLTTIRASQARQLRCGGGLGTVGELSELVGLVACRARVTGGISTLCIISDAGVASAV